MNIQAQPTPRLYTPRIPSWAAGASFWRDFVGNPNLNPPGAAGGPITFTRASAATRINAACLFETLGPDVPAFDFDPLTGLCDGFRVEGARTNIVYQSANPGASSGHENMIFESGPDGYKLIPTANPSLQHWARIGNMPTAIGTIYTCSIWVKAAEYQFAQFTLSSGFAPDFWLTVNLATGQPSYVSPGLSVYRIKREGEFWRISITASANAVSATGSIIVVPLPVSYTNRLPLYATDGVSGIVFSRSQMEAGAFPSSYIPTAGAAATRAADISILDSSAFAAAYAQNEGTVFVEWMLPLNTGGNQTILDFDGSSGGNRWQIHRNSGSNDIRLYTAVSPNSREIRIGGLLDGAIARNALAWSGGRANWNYATNGVTGTTTATAQVDPLNKMRIGTGYNGTEASYGYIRRLALYPHALTAAQLSALTTIT